MLIDPRFLIQDTIDRLEALAEILSVEPAGQREAPKALSPDERTRKEIGLSIRVLLPKLRSVRGDDHTSELPRVRTCSHCED